MASTKWTLFGNNEETRLSMLADCAKAEKSIVIEQFIFMNDEFGSRLIDICVERASKGVHVRFLWDAAGSFTFIGSDMVRGLRTKGIELLFWRTLIPGYFELPDYRSWFLRNHRRTLVIDEEIGYTGSICLKDQMRNWRDINVRLEGPVVAEMQNAFDRMWARAEKSKLPKRIFVGDEDFRYVTNYPAPRRRHIYMEMLKAINNSRQYIYLTNPYFVPTMRLARALERAAKRGVDVKIIIPESSEYYAVDLGARSFFNQLLEAGVHIFLYKGNMIHGKAAVIDDHFASVGSMNLDRISLLYNYEANIVSSNQAFCEEVAAHFVHDLQDSTEVSLQYWKNRLFIEKIPEILIRLVRKVL